MITPLSFTSTYKVNNSNKSSFHKFKKYTQIHKNENNVKIINNIDDKPLDNEKHHHFFHNEEQTLIVPDDMDFDVEKFCSKNGIQYKKLSTKELLNPDFVVSRIKDAPEKYKKAEINPSELEFLIKNQSSNLQYCDDDYRKFYFDSVDTLLKSGNDIPATTLIIRNSRGNFDLKYNVDNYGLDSLNDYQLYAGFIKQTVLPDHCIYFALKDMGVEKIPVYVDEESYEAGKILGLF